MKVLFKYLVLLLISAIITGFGILGLSKVTQKPDYKSHPVNQSPVKTTLPYASDTDLDTFLETIPQKPDTKEKRSTFRPSPMPNPTDPHWPKEHRSTPGTILLRLAPKMPAEATKSGQCKFKASVNTSGRIDEILDLVCSDSIFEAGTKLAVMKWILQPKIQYGRAIPFTSEEQTIKYELLDEAGNKIPE